MAKIKKKNYEGIEVRGEGKSLKEILLLEVIANKCTVRREKDMIFTNRKTVSFLSEVLIKKFFFIIDQHCIYLNLD